MDLRVISDVLHGRYCKIVEIAKHRGGNQIVSNSSLLSRISIDPNICGGKPCIKGHRIWVSLILDFLASGATMTDILADYPQLKTEDILACIGYGAEMSRVSFVDVLIESAA